MGVRKPHRRASYTPSSRSEEALIPDKESMDILRKIMNKKITLDVKEGFETSEQRICNNEAISRRTWDMP
jgi:hypothetical protein